MLAQFSFSFGWHWGRGNVSERKKLVLPDDGQLLALIDGNLNAYRKHYHLDRVSLTRKCISRTGSGFAMDFGVELKVRLNYETAGQLPHIQSMADCLGINARTSTAEELTAALSSDAVAAALMQLIQKSAHMSTVGEGDSKKEAFVTAAAAKMAAAGISELAAGLEHLYMGQTYTLNLSFRAALNRVGIPHAVAAVAWDGTEYDAALLVPASEAEMRANGIAQLQSIVDAAVLAVRREQLTDESAQLQSKPVYHRVTARNYANTWTSNPAGGGKDVRKWRTAENPLAAPPLYPANKRGDCANYVSQAIYAGGIPKTTTEVSDQYHWFASQHGCSLAWENCTALHFYFTHNGYWAASDYNCCNAGGVIFLKDQAGKRYHVVMCVQNDTITRLFSAHTNDKWKEAYTETSLLGKKCKSVEYWVFANASAD